MSKEIGGIGGGAIVRFVMLAVSRSVPDSTRARSIGSLYCVAENKERCERLWLRKEGRSRKRRVGF